jgi:hypothetical protein
MKRFSAVGKVVDLVGIKAVAGERSLTKQLALLDEELEALLAAQGASASQGNGGKSAWGAGVTRGREAAMEAKEHEYNVLRVSEERKRLQLAVCLSIPANVEFRLVAQTILNSNVFEFRRV